MTYYEKFLVVCATTSPWYEEARARSAESDTLENVDQMGLY